jgi:hypothetical protein
MLLSNLFRSGVKGILGSVHVEIVLCSLLLGLSPQVVEAQTTYTWNGSTSSAWNVPANWTPGTGFPSATDHAIIIAAANTPLLDMSRSVVNLTVNGGTLNLNGFTLTSTGNGALNGGAVNNGTFSPNTTGTMNFAGTVFGASVNGTTGVLQFAGSTFNGSVSLTKTGGGYDYSSANTVFNGPTTFTVTGGRLYLANTGNTQFNGDVVLNSTGTSGGVWMGQNTGTLALAAGRTISAGTFTSGSLLFRNFTQVGGTAQAINLTLGATLYFQAGSVFSGPVTSTAPGLYLNGSTFNATARFTKTGATNEYSSGNNIYQSTAEFTTTGPGNLFLANVGADQYNGDVLVNSSGVGGILFGNSTGTSTLAPGRTITIGATGYSSSIFQLGGFVQAGSTPQVMTFGSGTVVRMRAGSSFGGDLTLTARGFQIAGSTFAGNCVFTKIGASDEISTGGNAFQGNLELINTSTGILYFADSSPDTYTGDVRVSSTSTGQIRFGNSGTGGGTVAVGRTIGIGALGFDSGLLLLGGVVQLGSTPQSLTLGTSALLYFRNGSIFNGDLTAMAGRMFLDGSTFNAASRFTKSGGGGDGSQGGNVFNGPVEFSNTSTGNFSITYNGVDAFNSDITVNSTSTGDIRFGQNGGTAILADGRMITVGSSGFASGQLFLRNFLQTGGTPQSLLLGTGASLHLQSGSVFNGPVTASSGSLFLSGTTFNATGQFTKTGASGDGSQGGNVFNGTVDLINTGTGNFSVNFIGIDVFNENVRVSSTSTGEIRFGQNGGTSTLAAGRTLTVGALGFDSGRLLIGGMTQVGNTPHYLALGASATLFFQPGTTFNGDISTTSGGLFFNGTTFNGTGTFMKTGSSGDASSGGNVFNGLTEITNSGSGNLSICSTGTDQFNADLRLNNTSSGDIRFGQGGGSTTLASGRTITVGALGFDAGQLVIRNFTQLSNTAQELLLGTNASLYLQSGNVFNGDILTTSGRLYLSGTIFNGTGHFSKTNGGGDGSLGGNIFNGYTEFVNSGTGNLSLNYTGSDSFNGDVRLNNTSTGDIRFGQNGGNSTLASGRTIAVGSLGFNAGNLAIGNLVQLGGTPQVLALGTGATLSFNSGAIFNGDVSSTSGGLFFNGTTFNSAGRFTKSGPSGDGSQGGNIFNGLTEFINTSSGNLSLNYSGVDAFNADVRVSSTSTGEIRFGQNGGSSTLAAGRTITVGSLGFATGRLMFQNFLQVGPTPQALLLGTGALLYYQSGSVFNGTVTSTSGGLYFNGTTFNASGRFSKTGTSNDDSAGGNLFNGSSEFIKTGTGDLNLNYNGTDLFNGDVLLNCTSTGDISFGRNGGSATLAVGRSMSVGGLGFDPGRLLLRNFNQVGGTPQSLDLGASATLYYQTGTIFNGNITSSSGGLYFNGSTFNGLGRFTKTGPSGDGSTGGNIFNGTTEFILTSAGNLSLDWSGVDQFNADVLVNSTSTGQVQFGQNGGSATLATGRTIAVGASGFNTGQLIFRNFTQQGGAAQVLALGVSATCNFQSGTTFNGDLSARAGNLGLNGATFNGVNRFQKTGAGANSCSGNNLFVGTTELVNTGAGGWNMANSGVDTYQNGLQLNSTSTGGIYFGASGGTTTLANGTMGIGGTGFSAGTITFRNFTKVGTSAASLTGTASSSITFLNGNIFNGDLSATTGNLLLNGSVFNGNCVFNKTATANNSSAGGNTFNGSVEINTVGQMSLASNAADDFNGSATFRRLGAGTFVVGNNFNTSFSFNVSTVGSTGGPVQFGNGSGRTIFDGSTPQTFQGDAAAPPNVRNMTLAMTGAGELQLLSNVNVQLDIAFTSGVVKPMAATSTSTGLLILAHGSTMSDPADASSYAEGFVRKIGNTAFTFPVGGGGVFAPISMSAPAVNTHHFTARYVSASSHPTYLHTSKDITLDHMSQCEYWFLDRTNSTTNVSVTLTWNTPRSCGVTNLSQLAVARWNGSQWKDHGGTAIGSLTSGSITTSGPVSLFASPSPFTLASTGLANPLPIELISFTAVDEGPTVRTDWSTAVEVNNDHFEVERSQDGVMFEAIGSIEGAGNSQSTNYYSFMDEQPLSGTSYYRLKQVDTDGTFTYGPVAAVVRSNGIADLNIWPNPVEGEMNFTASGDVEAIRLHDAAGRLIEEQRVVGYSGVITVDLGGVPTGVLILPVTMQDGSIKQKRILKH